MCRSRTGSPCPRGRYSSREPGPGAERAPWTAQSWQGAPATRGGRVLFLHYTDQAFNARDGGAVSGRSLCVRDIDASERAFAVKAPWDSCQAGPPPGRVSGRSPEKPSRSRGGVPGDWRATPALVLCAPRERSLPRTRSRGRTGPPGTCAAINVTRTHHTQGEKTKK